MVMERRRLGVRGSDLPVVGLGTWQRLEAADTRGVAQTLVAAALDGGVEVFDSSPSHRGSAPTSAPSSNASPASVESGLTDTVAAILHNELRALS